MKVAENLKHFVLQAGSIYVHDSGYGYRDRVAQTTEAGAYTVTAFSPGSFPLEDEQAKSFEVVKWLKNQRARAGKICSITVFFRHGGNRYEARVVGLRRTEEQAQRLRRRKKKKAGQDHRKLQGETLYLAGWLLVLTTLPEAFWSAQEVLSLYRARWQIEVLFKRIKQLLCQHILRAETEETARATVYAILVSWVLQHEVALELRANLQERYLTLEEEGKTMIAEPTNQECQEEPAISEWQVQADAASSCFANRCKACGVGSVCSIACRSYDDIWANAAANARTNGSRFIDGWLILQRQGLPRCQASVKLLFLPVLPPSPSAYGACLRPVPPPWGLGWPGSTQQNEPLTRKKPLLTTSQRNHTI